MYQSFDIISEQGEVPARLDALRALMQRENLSAFLVPHGDEHRGEYLPASAERLAWITGFTGSAGSAVIALEKAALFVDGRYTAQAKTQTPNDLFAFCPIPGATPAEWIMENLPGEALRIGFDPWLHAPAEIDRIELTLKKREIELVPLTRNPIDTVWGTDRPKPPCHPIKIHSMAYAGVSATDKISALQAELLSDGQDATVLTATDSICWLLNIRGSDVPHNPIVLCFAIIHAEGKPELFIDDAKIDPIVRAYLEPIVKLWDGSKALAARLEDLAEHQKRVRIDRESCPVWIVQKLSESKEIVHGRDLCLAPRAIKNESEITGARTAHLRDGVAVCRFLAWLEQTVPGGEVDEISAAIKLETFRRESGQMRDISFATISGAGPNGAIVHYRVTRQSNRKLANGELYLVDSGAQYDDGTTDITRTIAIGQPTDEMCDRFTRVLKGHIAIAMLIFPHETRGVDIDAFARRALWSAGLDFAHGTGHGVGSYLSVHEGPQSISRRAMTAFKPGMIVSNEPGYYKEGAFGIRIENLVLVKAIEPIADGEHSMMAFETLTLAPIDRSLILPDMLTAEEQAWLNAYHAEVYSKISPDLPADDRVWLAKACAPL